MNRDLIWSKYLTLAYSVKEVYVFKINDDADDVDDDDKAVQKLPQSCRIIIVLQVGENYLREKFLEIIHENFR